MNEAPPPPPGFTLIDDAPPPPAGYELLSDHKDPLLERETEMYRRHGDIGTQALKGIPIIGALAEKGIAATNAAIDPLVGRGGDDYGTRYTRHMKALHAANSEYEAQHPVLAPAAQLAGGLATMNPGAGAGGRVAQTVLGTGGETLGGQVLRSGASGAGIGATDAALRGESPTAGGVIGGAMGAAGPIAGRAVGSIVNRVRGTTAAAVPPTEHELLAAGNNNYRAARASDLQVDPMGLHDMSNIIETDLLHGTPRGQSYHPDQAPQTFAVMRDLRDPPQVPPGGAAGTAPVGPPPASANALLANRDRLTAIIKQGAGPLGNKVDAAAATHALQQLDHYLEAIPGHHVIAGNPAQFSQQLAEGNANYGAGKRSERFSQDVLENASRNADVAHAGENVGNSTRQRMNAVIKSNQRGSELGRGLNDAELAAIDQGARGDRYTNTLRRVQSWTGGLKRGTVMSGIGATIGGSAAGAPGAAVGAAVPHVVSDLARRGAERRTVNAAHDIDEMIRRRSPLAAPANAAEAERQRVNTAAQRGGALASRAGEPSISNMLQQLFAPQQ